MMNLILLIDISGSMTGHNISAVTDAMENLLSELSDEEIDVSILLFSKSARWMIENPTPINNVKWEEPECNGMTSMGLACAELAAKLHEGESEGSNVFLLLSDGCPTDDFEDGLNKLLELKSFVKGHRRAIAIGKEADMNSLSKFAGDVKYVIKVEDLEYLLQAIMTFVNVQQFNSQEVQSEDKVCSSSISKESREMDDEWD